MVYLLTFFLSLNLFAMPKMLQVWFLSADVNSTSLFQEVRFSKPIAQRRKQCQKMGEYCFDPQVGLYRPDEDKAEVEHIEYVKVIKEDKGIARGKSLERNSIKCDKGKFFDLFCGDSKPVLEKKNMKTEVWFDISSTMRYIDPKKNKIKKCYRQLFLESLNEECPYGQKMDVNVFTERVRQIDTFSRVCEHDGLNSPDLLLRTIKKSDAENLIVITDIHENDGRFITALKVMGADIRGRDKPMYPSAMQDEVKSIANLCKK